MDSDKLVNINYYTKMSINLKTTILFSFIFLALHRCARNDSLQGCRILLSYNIDTTITSIQGFKAIDMATDNIKNILQG